MKMEKVLRSALLLLLAAALCLSMAACTQTPETAASEKASPEDDMPEDAGTEETPASDALSSALPVKTLRAKRVDENPYMAKSDANIHHDGYNTDSTDEVLPLGIYPEINVSYEKTNANASPAIYFDSYGHAVVPLLGGIAIRDLNAKETTTLGYFSPKQHDGGGYVIQSSYTFLDSENRIVCPTSNNHVLMLRATDEAGNILPEFEKVLDINIKAAAEAALGKTLEQNLLSVVFDHEGNLWFATGGFRIYPEREQQGVLGYIARSAIDAILRGEQADLSDAVFGEGREIGGADGLGEASPMGCILAESGKGREAYRDIEPPMQSPSVGLDGFRHRNCGSRRARMHRFQGRRPLPDRCSCRQRSGDPPIHLHRFAAIHGGGAIHKEGVARQNPLLTRVIGTVERATAHTLRLQRQAQDSRHQYA